MTCLLLFGFTKIQQFNINLLKNKEGMSGAELRYCPAGDLSRRPAGGMGIGFAGGLGVLVLTLIFQIKPGAIPFDVIEIIMAVIAAIAIRRSPAGWITWSASPNGCCAATPKYITFLAPLVTLVYDRARWHRPYRLSTLPVIAKVPRARHSSVSSTVDCGGGLPDSDHRLAHSRHGLFAGILEPLGVSYLALVICIPVALAGGDAHRYRIRNFLGCELKDDPVYQERLAKGEVRLHQRQPGI